MLVVMDQERYRLVDVIGSGGMATVWRAHDTRLGRVVALKRPHPAPADSTTLPRFAREARAAATVNHPNLVSVYDVGEDDAGPYLVMEYVDGPSLATTAVPHDGIAALGVQVASALDALHAAGIVHGDVKPANILVAGDGVKLTDFGIARTNDDTTALTREGVIFATPEYAAPETLSTGARTAAGDVYALGAVLHELVTGSRWSPTATATQAMPPGAWLPALSGALAQDPDRRPSAAALGTELARLEHHAAPHVTTVPTVATDASMPAPTSKSQASTGHRENGRTAAVIFVGAVLALAAVAGAIALSSDGGGVATMIPEVSQPESDDAMVVNTTSAPPEAAPPTDPPATDPPSTVAPTTVAPTTVAPTTVSPPTTAPTATITPARVQAEELATLIAAEVSRGLARDEALAIVENLNEALRAAEEGQVGEIERALRDARRRIDRHFEKDSRDEAIARLLAFGVELGIDPDRIVDSGPSPKNRDDDD